MRHFSRFQDARRTCPNTVPTSFPRRAPARMSLMTMFPQRCHVGSVWHCASAIDRSTTANAIEAIRFYELPRRTIHHQLHLHRIAENIPQVSCNGLPLLWKSMQRVAGTGHTDGSLDFKPRMAGPFCFRICSRDWQLSFVF